MLVQTLVSVGGIALVVVLARWLGVRRPAAALDNGTARAAGGGGRCFGGGGGWSPLTRRRGARGGLGAPPPPVRATVENADLIVDSGDPMFGAVRLRIGAAAAETLAARLRAAAG